MPFANEPSMIERCEIDLSPGTFNWPDNECAGLAINLLIYSLT